MARIIESLLRQKTKSKWLKEGDANTKYFHVSINWKRRNNQLKALLIDAACMGGRTKEN